MDNKDLQRYLDMNSWLNEKSKNVITYLSHLIDYINKNRENIPNDVYEEITYYLYPTLIDSTKVYGLICNSIKQTGREGEIIFEKGSEGLEEVLFNFGVIPITTKMKKINDLEDFINRLKISIHGDKSNRTLIHEALSLYQNRFENINKEISKLEDEIEKVTLNEVKWETFISTTKIIIPKLEQALENLKVK